MPRYDEFRPDDPSLGPLVCGAILIVSAVVTVLGWWFFFAGLARAFG